MIENPQILTQDPKVISNELMIFKINRMYICKGFVNL